MALFFGRVGVRYETKVLVTFLQWSGNSNLTNRIADSCKELSQHDVCICFFFMLQCGNAIVCSINITINY